MEPIGQRAASAMHIAAVDIRRNAILRNGDGIEDRHVCPDQDTAVSADEILIVNTWMMKPPKPQPEPSPLKVKSLNERNECPTVYKKQKRKR